MERGLSCQLHISLVITLPSSAFATDRGDTPLIVPVTALGHVAPPKASTYSPPVVDTVALVSVPPPVSSDPIGGLLTPGSSLARTKVPPTQAPWNLPTRRLTSRCPAHPPKFYSQWHNDVAFAAAATAVIATQPHRNAAAAHNADAAAAAALLTAQSVVSASSEAVAIASLSFRLRISFFSVATCIIHCLSLIHI